LLDTKKKPVKPTARQLLLKLISSRDGVKMNAAGAIRVGALFGISENNIRVTLARLCNEGLLKPQERGFYSLGAAGKKFAVEIATWRTIEAQLCPWQGDWILVCTGALNTSDRKALRDSERALKLMGMQKLVSNLYVRPNNFASGIDFVRARLSIIGLSPKAIVFNGTQFDPQVEVQARKLWETTKLESAYQKGLITLEESIASLSMLPLADAARTSYLIGDEALQRLVFDPLLPEPLLDVQARNLFRCKAREYDDIGARIWFRFLAQES
jgi:phenylacetic acid degradation operon negative regulatory protein